MLATIRRGALGAALGAAVLAVGCDDSNNNATSNTGAAGQVQNNCPTSSGAAGTPATAGHGGTGGAGGAGGAVAATGTGGTGTTDGGTTTTQNAPVPSPQYATVNCAGNTGTTAASAGTAGTNGTGTTPRPSGY